MKAELIDYMGSDLTVVNAARVSFNKASRWEEVWGKDEHGSYLGMGLKQADVKLIKYLAKNGHWTPFAHPQIQMRITAPVPIRTQFFKHKQGFVENEVSRRYVDDEPQFYTPEWRAAPTDGAKQGSSGPIDMKVWVHAQGEQPYAVDLADWYEKTLDLCKVLYDEMIAHGVAPEQARFVLPQAMYTEWYWTGSLAAYARFYRQRTDSHAQKEIQDLAKMVGELIEPLFPVSWKELTGEEIDETVPDREPTQSGDPATCNQPAEETAGS